MMLLVAMVVTGESMQMKLARENQLKTKVPLLNHTVVSSGGTPRSVKAGRQKPTADTAAEMIARYGSGSLSTRLRRGTTSQVATR